MSNEDCSIKASRPPQFSFCLSKEDLKFILIRSLPANIPGCAKKLAVRSSLFVFMMSTSWLSWPAPDTFSVGRPCLVWSGSKSISFSSWLGDWPVFVFLSVPMFGSPTIRKCCFIEQNQTFQLNNVNRLSERKIKFDPHNTFVNV